jgi:hypothetical protein
VVVTVTYPLVFVRGRARWLPVLAAAALVAQVLLAWAGRAAFGLAGVAAALALSTALVLCVLLVALGAFARVARGVVAAAAICGALAALVFAVPRIVLDPAIAAGVGVVLYAAVLAAWRPPGLRAAWAYLHALQ